MPINETIVNIVAGTIIIAMLFYCGVATYTIVATVAHHFRRKKLCRAIECVIVSYAESQKFDNAMAEMETIIQSIIKPDKQFPTACRSIGGLLKQYIYWLNTKFTTPTAPSIAGITTLKDTAHTLIDLYRTNSFSSESLLYNEPLLNELSQTIDKKDWDGVHKSIAELDVKLDKERKRANFIRNWVPPITTIVGAILPFILAAIFGQ